MDALESVLEEAKSQARSKEQKLLIITKELKVAEHYTHLCHGKTSCHLLTV